MRNVLERPARHDIHRDKKASTIILSQLIRGGKQQQQIVAQRHAVKRHVQLPVCKGRIGNV